MICPQCGATMMVIAFLTDFAVVDRIISHLQLTFFTKRPPPPQMAGYDPRFSNHLEG